VVRWNRTDGAFKRFTTDDGLLSNLIGPISIDHQGVKWFGHYRGNGGPQGITSYDNKKWTNGATAAMAIDKNNFVWFGYYSGVMTYTRSSLIKYSSEITGVLVLLKL